ncbi:MAG: hypothetical protein HUU14_11680 [Dehalococcoidia bacterium]|nr:MAG: hypothetical protein EDM76_04910 [bacterium]MCE7927610.1 hypothetical protein [Chloroflexi bacterium CFX7]MCK6564381.1 hypothetical protein [Dehalococcoidia bacterium]MCL4231351.1 hypothetical protein [Dehalococcoidia bacterium]NUQ56538.1 hypothetical protein [Dehalococcoidia bacterium]
MPPDLRLIQLARILGLDPAALSLAAAPSLFEAHPETLAAAFFAEAAANDDVTGPASALDYLDLRLDGFGDLVPAAAASRIRAAFEVCLNAWR